MSFWLTLSVTLNVILVFHWLIHAWDLIDRLSFIYHQFVQKDEEPLPLGFAASSQDIPREIILLMLGEESDKEDFLSSHEIFETQYQRLSQTNNFMRCVDLIRLEKVGFIAEIESADDRIIEARKFEKTFQFLKDGAKDSLSLLGLVEYFDKKEFEHCGELSQAVEGFDCLIKWWDIFKQNV
jgi:hypothetical protein